MFEAPEFIKQIPEIKTIYELNERQNEELDEATTALDNNLFYDTMDEETIQKKEKVFSILPSSESTLEMRRYALKAKEFESSIYSYPQLIKKLNTLCDKGYEISLNNARTELNIKVADVYSSEEIKTLTEFFENFLPLNMIFNIGILTETPKEKIYVASAVQTRDKTKIDVDIRNKIPIVVLQNAENLIILQNSEDILIENEENHLILNCASDFDITAENGHILFEE